MSGDRPTLDEMRAMVEEVVAAKTEYEEATAGAKEAFAASVAEVARSVGPAFDLAARVPELAGKLGIGPDGFLVCSSDGSKLLASRDGSLSHVDQFGTKMTGLSYDDAAVIFIGHRFGPPMVASVADVIARALRDLKWDSLLLRVRAENPCLCENDVYRLAQEHEALTEYLEPEEAVPEGSEKAVPFEDFAEPVPEGHGASERINALGSRIDGIEARQEEILGRLIDLEMARRARPDREDEEPRGPTIRLDWPLVVACFMSVVSAFCVGALAFRTPAPPIQVSIPSTPAPPAPPSKASKPSKMPSPWLMSFDYGQ